MSSWTQGGLSLMLVDLLCRALREFGSKNQSQAPPPITSQLPAESAAGVTAESTNYTDILFTLSFPLVWYLDHPEMHLGRRRQMKQTYQRLRELLVESHSVQITPEYYIFNTDADSRCRTLKSGAVRAIYICHRSYAPREKNSQWKKRFRNLDSNKINKACPSILVVTKTPHKLLVLWYPVHIGHSNELGQLSIPSIDKQQIASKLSQGVSVSRILNDIRADISEDGTKIIHLIEEQDIHNTKRDFSIG
ncbi:hypothetical protein HUJ05_012234 [Dendroctonus ponderosae]|nr:hypothetical protein HUJ05_012234 [Dendroctonus ponderosae]